MTYALSALLIETLRDRVEIGTESLQLTLDSCTFTGNVAFVLVTVQSKLLRQTNDYFLRIYYG